MANELFQTGEEFVIRSSVQDSDLSFDMDLEISLYDDTTDGLVDDSDPADVTTEPTGDGYARDTITLDSAEITTELNDDGNFQFEFEDQVFDVEDSTQDVNAYVVFVYFESEVADDTEISEHLYFAGLLDQEYDLGQIDEFVLRGTGLALD